MVGALRGALKKMGKAEKAEREASRKLSEEKRDAAAKAVADKANQNLPVRVVATALLPHEDYRSLAAEWRDHGNKTLYDDMIEGITGDGPSMYNGYRLTWNGDEIHPDDAIRAFAEGVDDDKVHMPSSLLSAPFACSGVSGNKYGTKGGGKTIMISKSLMIKNGQRIRYRFAPDGDAEPLELIGELWPDPSVARLVSSWES